MVDSWVALWKSVGLIEYNPTLDEHVWWYLTFGLWVPRSHCWSSSSAPFLPLPNVWNICMHVLDTCQAKNSTLFLKHLGPWWGAGRHQSGSLSPQNPCKRRRTASLRWVGPTFPVFTPPITHSGHLGDGHPSTGSQRKARRACRSCSENLKGLLSWGSWSLWQQC